ncbi:triacylglycerol lipase [Boeremia exigua]|uniref:triacylglycerol lipase n=1 Tax=Boeremia exigua TaxID=749465 RepID=UPI001E8E9B2C|nr:triacylglycerol lipase [Boeremia exigua]KAH6639849.1 triacylglycerol lipase [Boeremia exigua]
MRSFIAFLLCSSASLATASAHPRAESNTTTVPQVQIKNGTVTGTHIPSYKQDAFLGIPFAKPPTGSLRFSLPQPLDKAWNSSLVAQSYPPKCAGYGSEQIGDFEVSEDCLYLNVVRPTGYDDTKLPVAVWIHGGAFSQGGTVDTLYNMSYMIQNSLELNKPFIGVSLQYRLNAFGFVDSKEVKEAGVTNLGIRDQRLALQWVQENIAAFGGDSSKVTIFGESAGAASIGIHLTAYGGRDDKLFSAAIMESGAPLLLGSKYNAAVEQAKYDKLVSATGCSSTFNGTLHCLRGLSYATINAALNGTAAGSFFPYVDGDLVKGSLYDQLEAGAFVKVPIIAGTNSDEGIFTALGVNINTDAEFKNRAAAYGSNSTVPFLEVLYPNINGVGVPEIWTVPPPGRGSQTKRWAALSGDYTFVAPKRLTCQSWSKQNVTAYCYRFNGEVANLPGSTHFVEVPYVFYNLQRMAFVGGADAVPASYRDTAKMMSNMWVSFFTTQDPNGHGVQGAAEWPRYDDGAGGYGQNFVFEVKRASRVERDSWRAAGIAYLNSVFGSQYGK